jgi:predicted signal transduction protein with EAL and GGDEF domain
VTILLADDDPVSCRILQRTLERSGFAVRCVADGREAADVLMGPDGPRMAIMNWVMPGQDGPSVCRQVRGCADVPYVYLILLTARDATGDVVLGLEAGADDYLIKPCNPHELKARIRAGERILELQDKLMEEAQHDALTKLPNRGFFVKRLTESVRRTRERSGYQFTLLFVDVDRFKVINDSLGHMTGDEVMKGIAQRLVQAVRTENSSPRENPHTRKSRPANDVVARIGGDEFVILLDDFASLEDGVRVAERIQRVLQTPFRIDEQDIFVTASIGISTSGGEETDPEEILRGADSAMYRAKLQGKARYEVSEGNGRVAASQDFKLERDLRGALENKEFEVFYQPIVDLLDNHVVKFEALVRWRHPELGLVQPGAFIPVAEESGLIVPMGEWVMREACRQAQEWNLGLAVSDPVGICVNISPKQFGTENLVQRVREILAETGLEPHLLKLEVTENLTMKDAGRTTQIMHELSAVGASLSLDDFGTGYSSLSYLKRFPIRTLKIDRSFVADMERSKESCDIVQTVIALGHRLGLRVVAEGIETEAQRKLLKAFRCDMGQGYLFSRPVEAERAAAMLEGRSKHVSARQSMLPAPRSAAERRRSAA